MKTEDYKDIFQKLDNEFNTITTFDCPFSPDQAACFIPPHVNDKKYKRNKIEIQLSKEFSDLDFCLFSWFHELSHFYVNMKLDETVYNHEIRISKFALAFADLHGYSFSKEAIEKMQIWNNTYKGDDWIVDYNFLKTETKESLLEYAKLHNFIKN